MNASMVSFGYSFFESGDWKTQLALFGGNFLMAMAS